MIWAQWQRPHTNGGYYDARRKWWLPLALWHELRIAATSLRAAAASAHLWGVTYRFTLKAIRGFFVRGQGLAPWSFTLVSKSKAAALPPSASPRRLPLAADGATRGKTGNQGSLRV